MDPYRISVSVHDVQRIELQAVRTIRDTTRVVRDIVIHDAHGERLVIQCFAENADALVVRDLDFAEEPKRALPAPKPTREDAHDDHCEHLQGRDGWGVVPPCTCGFAEREAKRERDAEGSDPKGWQPPPNPRPHAFPEAGGNCTRCDATPNGPMSRLACCIAAPSRLTEADRAEAAQAGARA